MQPSARGPLLGVIVVETAAEPGARYCGRLFAALGATVVRVRSKRAAAASPGQAAFELWLDADKIEADSFEDAATRLGRAPDVVVAGQTPALVAQADAEIVQRGWDTLRLGLTWFGDEGPYAPWRGDDGLIQALIGIASGFGAADGPPMMPQGRAPQLTAGAALFAAGLAVLWGRRRGRAEQRVDVNVLEAALAFIETGPPSVDRMADPPRAVRRGVNRFAVNHPCTVYRTADGWLGVTTLTPAQWAGFCQLIERPEWAHDPRFASSLSRVQHADGIDEALNRILPTRDTLHWLIGGQKLRVPLAPAPRHAELIDTPHWMERGAFVAIPHAPGVQGPGLPFRMSGDGVTTPVPRGAGAAPLAGLRVVDFSMGWAGPLCTRLLGDFGADVVKIESDAHYDWWRGWEPPGASDPPQYELPMPFNVMNRNKRGISLDLTTPDGVARAKALVAGADVVVENYAPGVMRKLGLDAEALQAVRPGLVMLSMGAFGARGPWSFFRAYGSTVEHASGMPHLNGQADWPPCLQHAAYGDPVAGVYGAIAVLSALHGRDSLGGGWLDLAQVECLFQLGADAIIAAQVDGDPPRLGNRSPYMAPRCVAPSADPERFVAIVATDDAAWRALCGVLERPGWLNDPSMATPAGRNGRGAEIEAAIAAWVGARDDTAAVDALQSAGVPAAPVTGGAQLITDPQLAATGAWMRIERRHVGRHLMAAPPVRVDGLRPAVLRPAPVLGEHTAEVLRELAPAP